MLRAAEGVFNHIPSFRCKQSRERFHQRFYHSFPCLANPLISVSAGAAAGWRGGRGGDTGAADPQAMGGPCPCPLCPWIAPSPCFVSKLPGSALGEGSSSGGSWLCPGLDVPAQLFQDSPCVPRVFRCQIWALGHSWLWGAGLGSFPTQSCLLTPESFQLGEKGSPGAQLL